MAKALVIVDVQPAFRSFCDCIAKQVAQQLNRARCPVVIYWVGEGLTDDTEDTVRWYLGRNGATQSRLAEARFIEKDYGFLRGWMDWGVEPDIIIKAGKALLKNGVNDSRNIDLTSVLDEYDLHCLPPVSPLMLPAFDIQSMLAVENVDICGGGTEQCLAEMEYVLAMHNKPYNRLSHLTY